MDDNIMALRDQHRVTAAVVGSLHSLRTLGNRCDHDEMEDLKVTEKPSVVSAAFEVIKAVGQMADAEFTAESAAARVAAGVDSARVLF